MKTFYIAIIILTILGFFLFVPKVATRVFPFTRTRLLKNFLNDVKINKSIDGRKFWVLREYYSPGSFTFKEKGLTKDEVIMALKKINVTFNNKYYIYPFLTFTSDKFFSIEALVTINDLNRLVNDTADKKLINCIIDQKTAQICYRNEKEIEIRFVNPMDEMRRTNGFFDYKRQNLAELTNGKYWLVISTIEL